MKLYSPVVGDSKTGGTLQLAGNSGTSDDWNLETETTANLELTVNSSVERYLNISNSGAGVAGLSIDGHLILPLVNDAATPTLAFGDGDTGFYESVDDTIALANNGTVQLYFTTAYMNGTNNDNFAIPHSLSASYTVPTYTFVGDVDTGVGRGAADQLSLIAGGLEMLRLSETGLASTDSVTMSFTGADKFLWVSNVYKGVSSGSFALLNEPSLSTNPTLCPNGNDYSTGLGAPASGQLSLITGGVEAVRIDASQNVAVTGNITQPNSLIGDATVTTTSTTQTALHTFAHATYGAAEYLIQATQGTARHITKVLITHDGTTAISTEYGEVITGASLYTVQVDISGADARLLITTGAATSTVYKTSYTLIEA